MEKTQYHAYLRSPRWREIRKEVQDRSNGVCERCSLGYPAADVHHLTYARVGNERLEDLLHVCRCCHEFLHDLSKLDPVQYGWDWGTFFALKLFEPTIRK